MPEKGDGAEGAKVHILNTQYENPGNQNERGQIVVVLPLSICVLKSLIPNGWVRWEVLGAELACPGSDHCMV